MDQSIKSLIADGLTFYLSPSGALRWRHHRRLTAQERALVGTHKGKIISMLEADDNADLFTYLLDSIITGGPYSKLWPKVRGYCRRELNRSQFNELESAYRKQPDKGPDFINTNQN